MLKALADGETDPAALATLAHQRLRATPAELRDTLGACTELNPVYRLLVRLALDNLQLIEQQIGQLDQEIAILHREHQDAVQRGNGLRKSQAWDWVRRGKSLPKWVPTQRPSLPPRSGLLGRSMPGRRRERRLEPQQTFAERQPSDVPHSQSSSQCCRQT
jgi:hypothetical protein